MTIIEKIKIKCTLPDIVKKTHGSSPQITSEQFISAIISSKSATEAAQYLKIGEQTLNRILSKYLIPKFGKLNGGGETWKFVLLRSVEYKFCYVCEQIKPYSKFGLDKHTTDGRFKKCRYCRSFDNASLYSSRKLRIPSWYLKEKKQIAAFYDGCPEGFHVDHIIPLQGELVSGLHTLSNLQYLPAADNIAKGNTFDIMGDW